MKKLNLGTGILIGILLTATLIAIMYLGAQIAGLPFAPFDLFDWMTRVLPGPVITFGIDRMIATMVAIGLDVADTAKTAEQTMAVLQFFALGVVVATLFFVLMKARGVKADRSAGVTLGALFGLPMIALSIAVGQSTLNPGLRILWLAVLFVAWGLAVSWSYNRLFPVAPAMADNAVEKLDRRQFVVRLGVATATITVVGAGLGALLARNEQRQAEAALADSTAHNAEGTSTMPFPNANDPVAPVPGTRPEYTPVKNHYKVFLRTEPTVIDGATWSLPITGMVDNPLMLKLDDIRKYESRDQYVTLSCISGNVGTTLIGTTQWTGVSVQKVLADAKVRPTARYLVITSGDGFYESVDLAAIAADERIMFCYAWDGNTLPVDHGFPLRIWLPDHFGMKQPKWITGIEVTDQYKKGYWVDRGWNEVAQVKTTSVIDTVAVDAIITNGDKKLVPIGGMAFAGARGIAKVEVRVDGGPWQPAQLRTPLSDTTWVLWRYEWPFAAGSHNFEVHCVAKDGKAQIETVATPHPDGATGIHHKTAKL